MTIKVVSVTDVPLAVNDSVIIQENQNVTIDVLGNDLIGDSDTLEIISTTDPSQGSISITDDGSISYSPNTNVSGSDSFTYTITGGSVATVEITINPVVDDEDDDRNQG